MKKKEKKNKKSKQKMLDFATSDFLLFFSLFLQNLAEKVAE